MKKIENYENVQASTGEFERLPVGGYICRITLADDVPFDSSTGKGDYLKIEYDVAAGDFKDYYSEQFKKFSDFWGGRFIRSYKEKALGMFKHFTDCLEKSNAGYTWNWDEKTLQGKLIGLVIGEEEYENSDGELKTRLYVNGIKTVDDIKNGNFKLPQLKKLKTTSATPKPQETSGFTEANLDDDLPF